MGVSVSTVTASSARRSSSDCMSSMETWSDTGPAAGFAVSGAPDSSSFRISRARVMTRSGMPASLATSMP